MGPTVAEKEKQDRQVLPSIISLSTFLLSNNFWIVIHMYEYLEQTAHGHVSKGTECQLPLLAMPSLGCPPSSFYYLYELPTIMHCGCFKTSVSVNQTGFNWQQAGGCFLPLMVKKTFLWFQSDQKCLLRLGFQTETPIKCPRYFKYQQWAISVWYSPPPLVYQKRGVREH